MKYSDYESVSGFVNILKDVSDEKLNLIKTIVLDELDRRKKPKLTLIEGGKNDRENRSDCGDKNNS